MTDDPANLSKLHDIVVLPDVSWWPLAPGWIALSILAIIALCYFGYSSFMRWKQNAYRRDALKQLAATDSPAQIAEILRRTALVIAPREEIATLQGSAWIDWLAAQTGTKPSDTVRKTLTQSIYEATGTAADLTPLREFAEAWISRHKTPC